MFNIFQIITLTLYFWMSVYVLFDMNSSRTNIFKQKITFHNFPYIIMIIIGLLLGALYCLKYPIYYILTGISISIPTFMLINYGMKNVSKKTNNFILLFVLFLLFYPQIIIGMIYILINSIKMKNEV